MTDFLQHRLGNYALSRLIGRGGFADVYLGEHVHLHTLAAIKVLHTQLTEEDIWHFRTEGRTVAHLVHPHIVRVLEFGVEGTIPFLVMDYAPNGTLRQRHARGIPVAPHYVVSYVKQIASALQYAHMQNIIHRDIKPENILLGRNQEVLLGDFGIALVVQSIVDRSMRYASAEAAGSVVYMAPEQHMGRPCPTSDQYALGIMAYEWLCGERPFNGTYMEIAAKHMWASPPPLRARMPSLPAEVEQVLLTALTKDPHQRFKSMQAFATAFEQAFQGDTITVAADSDPTPPALLPADQWQTPVRVGPGFTTLAMSSHTGYGQSAQESVPPSPPVSPSREGSQVKQASLPDTPYSGAGWSAPALPQPLPRKRTRWIAALLALALLIVSGSFAAGIFTLKHQYDTSLANITATANARGTMVSVNLTATAKAIASATANAAAEATAAAMSPYPFFSALKLNDALNGNSSSQWDEGQGCSFTGKNYQASVSAVGNINPCFANAPFFDDFAYQVNMTILKGDCGGLLFRALGTDAYVFEVCQDGTYGLAVYNTGKKAVPLVNFRYSSAIHTGLNQSNLIAVVAQGNSISLYINDRTTPVSTVTDPQSTFIIGQIGVLADAMNSPSAVAYTSAYVWA